MLLHGVRLSKSSLAHVAADFVDAGYRALLVDSRGHGASSGRYLTYGSVEARDVAQLLDAVEREGNTLGPVGIFGYSYGGAVAIQAAAADPRAKAVVAVAPFASLREVVGDYRCRYLPWPLSEIPDGWFQTAVDDAGQLTAFDPDEGAPLRAAEQSTARLLIIHGTDDTQVPLRHGVALARAAGSRSQLVEVAGAGHVDVLVDRSGFVRHRAVDWFAR